MKPRNFTIMYAVIRTTVTWGEGPEIFWVDPVILGVFNSREAAQDKADAWHQEIKDKNAKLGDGFKFTIQSTIYYDL